MCRLGSNPGVVTFGQHALTQLSPGVPTYKIYFYLIFTVTYTVFLYGNWDLIIFTVMYHTVTSNHGNLAFCTVIFCTVMVNVLYYGNGPHGNGKCVLSR